MVFSLLSIAYPSIVILNFIALRLKKGGVFIEINLIIKEKTIGVSVV